MSHADPSYPGNAITKDEWDILNRKPSTSTAINIAKNINIQNGFSIGETLIVINKRTNQPQTTNDGVSPQKYMVIHKDECGMIYCKRITAGRLGKGIEIIATWDHKNSLFMQDPDVIEHVLLGNEADYDPFKKSRLLVNLRQRISKHNNQFAFRFETADEAQKWIDDAPVGFRFWKGSESDRSELEVIGTTTPPRPTWASQNHHSAKLLLVRFTDGTTGNMQAYEFSSRYSKYYKEKPRVFREECDGVELLKQRKQRKKKDASATP